MKVTNKILITGAAGFIGFHLSKRLISKNIDVYGIDNLNDYYDRALKDSRLEELQNISKKYKGHFYFTKLDLANRDDLHQYMAKNNFTVIINLAAQAGVRYSIDNPHSYVDSNLLGFMNILESSRRLSVSHFIFASSSSVYGMNNKVPFSVGDNTDYPISLYAATKKSNELMAHSYAHLYDLPVTGLRFFTVYGPFGRPDMAYYKFTKNIISGKPIDVFNDGKMKRDFTYVDDVIEGITRIINKLPKKTKSNISNARASFKIYNIGNNNPIELDRFIKSIETATGIKSIRNNLPMQAGDVPVTFADVDDLVSEINFKPETSIEVGISKFVEWYKSFIKKNG